MRPWRCEMRRSASYNRMLQECGGGGDCMFRSINVGLHEHDQLGLSLKNHLDLRQDIVGCCRVATRASCLAPCVHNTAFTLSVFRVRSSWLSRSHSDSPILFVEPKWIDLILSTDPSLRKTIEVRPKRIHRHVGKRIRLAAIGRSEIWGTVCLTACSAEPLTNLQWQEWRVRHRVPGPLYYGTNTYAWHLERPERCVPYSFSPKHGAQTWQLD